MFCSLLSAGSLSNHFGTSISAAAPSSSLPSSRTMRARTKACGAEVRVTTPKRNGSLSRTSRSKKEISFIENRILTVWSRRRIVESFEHAAHVADGARRGARAVGNIVEGFHRDVAAIAMSPQRGEQGSEFLLALSRAAAVAIVQLHVRDHPPRQPALDQRRKRLLLHAAPGAAIEHALDLSAADVLHHAGGLLQRVGERRLLRPERLHAIHNARLLRAPRP